MRDVFGYGASLGDQVCGFAIDPVILEWLISRGFGSHRTAKIWLSSRIRRIEEYRRPWRSFPNDEAYQEFCRDFEQRIIEGLILNKVEGFATPILMLDDCEVIPREHQKRIANHLKSQKQFIPVDSSGQLIEG